MPTPHAALDELQTAREAILDYQSQIETRFQAAAEEVKKAQLEEQKKHSRNLNAELLELYRDRRAEDLPEPISQALYRFTRQAEETEEPVICNNAEELPVHNSLVNLAALPVSIKSDLKGVILVANKRDGMFDDDGTELLLAIGRHAGIAMENQRLYGALGDAFISTVAVLADAVKAKDPSTRGHCEGVSDLAARSMRSAP